MASKDEVELFLKYFKIKLEIWGIIFLDNRGKNTQALADLGITRNTRKEILKTLSSEDYSEGPVEEQLFGGSDMWIFGKMAAMQEVYIKITMGKMNQETICISFHIAEHVMNYPLKN